MRNSELGIREKIKDSDTEDTGTAEDTEKGKAFDGM
jgi:hypothetical protein